MAEPTIAPSDTDVYKRQVEKDMQISFDDAFRIVHDYAEQDDAYCQYVIGNVFFWRDDNRIEAAKDMRCV